LANVMVSMKIFPSDIVSNMSEFQDRVRKTLEGKATIYKFEEEPVAFGLVALIAHVVMPEDVEGRMDEVEGRLKSMPGVSEVQVLVSRRV
jgi:translation elongation factor aEF-1 beta